MLKRLSTLVNRNKSYPQDTESAAPLCEELYTQMQQIEKTLSKVATKPILVTPRGRRRPTPESVSESQRLIDLAG